MPKTTSTRTAKAYRLARDVFSGPSFAGVRTEKDKREWNLFMSTWLLPQMTQLIPELRELKFNYASSTQPDSLALPGWTHKNEDSTLGRKLTAERRRNAVKFGRAEEPIAEELHRRRIENERLGGYPPGGFSDWHKGDR